MVLVIGDFGMETKKFFFDQIVFGFHDDKFLFFGFFFRESREAREFSSMLASSTFELVCGFDSILDSELIGIPIFIGVLFEKETLQLSHDTLGTVS